MKISLIMCILKILTDSCLIKQKIKIKNIFANVIYSVLVVKKFSCRTQGKLSDNKW